MRVLHILAMIAILTKAAEGRRTTCSLITHFTIVYPNNPSFQETCRRCPKCLPGQGLAIQCGSRVANGTYTGCQPCETNKTYSDKYDSSTCKSCNLCGLKNVLQHCTPWQNRKCGTTCPPEHFLNDHNDCTKCYFCCDNVPEHDRLKQCKDLGMPRSLQCERTHENEKCKASLEETTTKRPVTTTEKETPTSIMDEETDPHVNSEYSSGRSHPTTPSNLADYTLPVGRDAKTSPPIKDKNDKIGLAFVITVVLVIVIGLALALFFAKKKSNSDKNADQKGNYQFLIKIIIVSFSIIYRAGMFHRGNLIFPFAGLCQWSHGLTMLPEMGFHPQYTYLITA